MKIHVVPLLNEHCHTSIKIYFNTSKNVGPLDFVRPQLFVNFMYTS